MLTRISAIGLTRPGGRATGTGQNCTITTTSKLRTSPEIMYQLCTHLNQLTSPEIHTAIELAIDPR